MGVFWFEGLVKIRGSHDRGYLEAFFDEVESLCDRIAISPCMSLRDKYARSRLRSSTHSIRDFWGYGARLIILSMMASFAPSTKRVPSMLLGMVAMKLVVQEEMECRPAAPRSLRL